VRSVAEGADARNGPAIERRDEVSAIGSRWRPVVELPAEHARVEGRRRIHIGLFGVDPGWDSGRKSLTLGHTLLLSISVCVAESGMVPA
jgi:hypothetical protein